MLLWQTMITYDSKHTTVEQIKSEPILQLSRLDHNYIDITNIKLFNLKKTWSQQETQFFYYENCEHELPRLGSLMKHLRKVHDVRDLALV